MTVSRKRILSIAVVGSLCATAALAIAILLFSEFDETQARILGTTALIALAGLLALPAGILLDRRKAVPLAWALVVLTAGGFVLAVVGLWWPSAPVEVGKAVATVVAFTVATTQAAALVVRRNDADPRSVRRLFGVSVVLAGVAASLVSIGAWTEAGDELYLRVLGALVVADVLAVVLQPALARTARMPTTYRLRLVVEPDEERSVDVDAESFAAAAARAIAAAERNGARVRTIDRVG